MRRICLALLLFLVSVLPISAEISDNPVRLFPKDYDFWDCDWSPDGQKLALAGKLHSQPANKAHIWLFDKGLSKPVLWTNTEGLCDDWPRWSPNGKSIALVRRELTGERGSCIWLKDLATGAGRKLTKGPNDRQPSWSPDGKAIVFNRGTGKNQSVLAVVDLASGVARNLAVTEGFLGEPFWGSDGKIYYTSYQFVVRETTVNGQNYRVQIISGRLWFFDPATQEGGPLTTGESDQRMPVLSPDQKQLAFYGQIGQPQVVQSIPDPAQWALFTLDKATGKCQQIVVNVALTGGPPVWSRDNNAVTIYSLRDKYHGLWQYLLVPPSPAPVPPAAPAPAPVPSP